MKDKFKNFFYSLIKYNYKILIIYLIVILMSFVKIDYKIYSPGGLINLEDRIEIKDSSKSEGSINLTYVKGREASVLSALISYLMPSWDLILTDEERIEDEPLENIEIRNKIYLDTVNQNAIIVAFDSLGKRYEIKENGVIVSHIYNLSESNLEVGDIIIGLENIKVKNKEDFLNIISSLTINQRVNLKVMRDGQLADAYAYIKESQTAKIIGVAINDNKELITSPEVKFNFKKNEMGPSGGLMTSLKIYDMISKKDITKGRIISGTGTINENGEVGEISGVKYKLAGAVKKNADIFLCPSKNFDECASEKKKQSYKINIIEADTFSNVLKKLNE